VTPESVEVPAVTVPADLVEADPVVVELGDDA